jgi:2-dehydropantoate 2-reductase
MKIAVVGCGALGSYYGARLCRIGEDVHFLLRSDFAVVARQGVHIKSPEGDFTVRPHAAAQPGDIGVCDAVLIGLKTTANAQFPRLLTPLVGPQTLVVTLQNGLGNEEQLAALFGPQNILGGLCFVCLNRLEPGLVQHFGQGRIVLGEYQRPAQARTHALTALFQRSGVPCKTTENLDRAHWEKLVWNIPFNGLGVAGTAGLDAVRAGCLTPAVTLGPCLPTDVLLGNPRWLLTVRQLMMEVITTANHLGHDLTPSLADALIENTLGMGTYYASTLLDFAKGLPLELDSLFRIPLQRAQQAKVETPRLAAMVRVLEQLAPR